jgi:hypothetical protein
MFEDRKGNPTSSHHCIKDPIDQLNYWNERECNDKNEWHTIDSTAKEMNIKLNDCTRAWAELYAFNIWTHTHPGAEIHKRRNGGYEYNKNELWILRSAINTAIANMNSK